MIDELVEKVDERNIDEVGKELIGVSVDKCFIKSVANVNGTDLSKYKVIHKNDFAVSLMQVSRDAKIPIARLEEYDVAIMSPAYPIFRVKDTSVVLPEYLEMWFKRPEFDREAAFIAVGGVRGSMPWEEFVKMKLPVPSLDIQKNIVKSYKIIADRIALKQKINDNLRATGIAVVEKSVGTATLINKTQAELDSILLPEEWSITTVSEFCRETKSGSTPSRSEPSFWNNGTIPWLKSGEVHNGISLKTEELITQSALENSSVKLLPPDTVLMAMYGVTAGEVGYLAIPATTNQAVCGMVCPSRADAAYLFFALLQNQDAASRLSNGGAQDNLSKNFIDGIHLICPPEDYIQGLQLLALIENMTLVSKELDCLEQLQVTILSELSRR